MAPPLSHETMSTEPTPKYPAPLPQDSIPVVVTLTRPAIVVNHRPLPTDILLLIFLEVFRSPPSLKSLRNIVPKTQAGLASGCDPLSICPLKEVCREFYEVIASCRELRSAVLIALPFYTRRLEASRSLACVKPWRLSHVESCSALVQPGQPLEVRLFISSSYEKSSGFEQGHTRRALKPFLDTAESIIVHGHDPSQSSSSPSSHAFLSIHNPLVNVKRIVLDHVKFGVRGSNIPQFAELFKILRLLPNLESLTLCDAICSTQADDESVVHKVTFMRLIVIDTFRLLRELLQRLIVTQPLSIYAKPTDPCVDDWVPLSDDGSDVGASFEAQLRTSAARRVIENAANVTFASLNAPSFWRIRPVLTTLGALEVTETSFTPALWDCFNSSSLPSLAHLSLTHCSFTPNGLRSLYDREHNAIFYGDPFSWLTVKDCNLDGLLDVLLVFLEHRVERVQWIDPTIDIDHTRLIAEEFANAPWTELHGHTTVSPSNPWDCDADVGDEDDEADMDSWNSDLYQE